MDPLQPVTYGPPAPPARRVPAVPRLPKVSREGDHPPRDSSERRQARDNPQPPPYDEKDGGEGHVDVRV